MAAAVSISPLPYTLSDMSGRRAPLSNNLNAANSPFRAVAAAAASKQKRSFATIQREDSYGNLPPAKKQMLDHQIFRTPPRPQSTQSSAEGRVFTRKSTAPQPSAFERKCVAARERPAQQPAPKGDITEQHQQWQRQQKRLFPKFVFYFESVSEDIRLKCIKQVTALGAREEKFFSNEVTHVVTTRSVPPQLDGNSDLSSATNETHSQNSHPQTINPLLLDRSSESTSDPFRSKTKFMFDVPMNRKLAIQGRDGDVRRQQGRNADVLHRARELGIKIWTLEKLQRMMTNMYLGDAASLIHGHNTRSNTVQGGIAVPRANREADLSQLLRNERINGPSDRDPTVATREMNLFKGPFIYIHDIDEKQKPIMVREYPKAARKEDGDWPQFRSVANGKCPFVEEVDKKEVEKERDLMRLQKQQEKEKSMVPRTRAAAAVEASQMQPPRLVTAKRPLADIDSASNRNITVVTKQANPFNTSSKHLFSNRTEPEPSSRGQQNAFVSRAASGRLFHGEPVASGVQQSNITSAIRSTMISSTAAQPGARAGTSKEVHGLQRKVLEKNSGGTGSYGVASSHRMTDLNIASRDEIVNRPVKRKHERLDQIDEDCNPSEREERARKVEATRKAKAVQQRRSEKRDPKPGYCENCQDKFEDFDEHILSRKHRKFAEKADNWKELDELLNKLARPVQVRSECPEDEGDY